MKYFASDALRMNSNQGRAVVISPRTSASAVSSAFPDLPVYMESFRMPSRRKLAHRVGKSLRQFALASSILRTLGSIPVRVEIQQSVSHRSVSSWLRIVVSPECLVIVIPLFDGIEAVDLMAGLPRTGANACFRSAQINVTIGGEQLFRTGPAELVKDVIAQKGERARNGLIDRLHCGKQARVAADPRLSSAGRDGDANPKSFLQLETRARKPAESRHSGGRRYRM